MLLMDPILDHFITFGNWRIHCNSLRMDPWLGGLEGQSRFVREKGRFPGRYEV